MMDSSRNDAVAFDASSLAVCALQLEAVHGDNVFEARG